MRRKRRMHLTLYHLQRKDRSACGIDLYTADAAVDATIEARNTTCARCRATRVWRSEMKKDRRRR